MAQGQRKGGKQEGGTEGRPPGRQAWKGSAAAGATAEPAAVHARPRDEPPDVLLSLRQCPAHPPSLCPWGRASQRAACCCTATPPVSTPLPCESHCRRQRPGKPRVARAAGPGKGCSSSGGRGGAARAVRGSAMGRAGGIGGRQPQTGGSRTVRLGRCVCCWPACRPSCMLTPQSGAPDPAM